jgi:Reverse transcriptase (RNA-dependent DNA polymerase)
MAFLGELDKKVELDSYQEAKEQLIWNITMKDEIKTLEKNKTWTLVPLPKGKKSIGCKWIYKTKYNSDGTIERHKARLVAKCFTQTYGIDYQETFAPVAKMSTVRILLSIAVNLG